MIRLDRSLRAWGTPDFSATLKQEISQLEAGQLPLQQGLCNSSSVSEVPITVMIHSMAELDEVIRVKAGIFYQGIIGGCNCSDDPTTPSDINEYCEVQLDIEKSSALTSIALIAA